MGLLDYASAYVQDSINALPEIYKIPVYVTIYSFFIVVYSIFIWRFYRFLAKREIIKLDLNKYNNATHPVVEKILAIFLYTIEYIVVLPFLVFFWFIILTLFLFFLSGSQEHEIVLLISSSIIISTRILAYIKEDMSRDFARIFPFAILAMFAVSTDFFNFQLLFDKIVRIPLFINNAVLIFIIFIFGVEFVMRIFYSLKEMFDSVRPNEDIEKNIILKKKNKKEY